MELHFSVLSVNTRKMQKKTVKNFLKVVGNHYGISENFETLLEKFPRDITTYIMNISLPL